MTCRLRVLASILFSAAVLMFAVTVAAASGVTPGDADGDGAVTVMDVSVIQRSLADMRIDGSLHEAAADVDGNGIVDIADATLIQRWLAGIETPYPIGVLPTEPPTAAPAEHPTDADGWGREIFRP